MSSSDISSDEEEFNGPTSWKDVVLPPVSDDEAEERVLTRIPTIGPAASSSDPITEAIGNLFPIAKESHLSIPSAQTNAASEQFNSRLYLSSRHKETSYKALKVASVTLKQGLEDNLDERQLLVNDHIDEFITCRDTLIQLATRMHEDQILNQDFEDAFDTLGLDIKGSFDLARKIWLDDIERDNRAERHRRLYRMLDRFRNVLGLPSAASAFADEGNTEGVIRIYRKRIALEKSLKAAFFQTIFSEVDKIIESYTETLFGQLENAVVRRDQDRIIQALFALDAESSPVKFCLIRQHNNTRLRLLNVVQKYNESLEVLETEEDDHLPAMAAFPHILPSSRLSGITSLSNRSGPSMADSGHSFTESHVSIKNSPQSEEEEYDHETTVSSLRQSALFQLIAVVENEGLSFWDLADEVMDGKYSAYLDEDLKSYEFELKTLTDDLITSFLSSFSLIYLGRHESNNGDACELPSFPSNMTYMLPCVMALQKLQEKLRVKRSNKMIKECSDRILSLATQLTSSVVAQITEETKKKVALLYRSVQWSKINSDSLGSAVHIGPEAEGLISNMISLLSPLADSHKATTRSVLAASLESLRSFADAIMWLARMPGAVGWDSPWDLPEDEEGKPCPASDCFFADVAYVPSEDVTAMLLHLLHELHEMKTNGLDKIASLLASELFVSTLNLRDEATETFSMAESIISEMIVMASTRRVTNAIYNGLHLSGFNTQSKDLPLECPAYVTDVVMELVQLHALSTDHQIECKKKLLSQVTFAIAHRLRECIMIFNSMSPQAAFQLEVGLQYFKAILAPLGGRESSILLDEAIQKLSTFYDPNLCKGVDELETQASRRAEITLILDVELDKTSLRTSCLI